MEFVVSLIAIFAVCHVLPMVLALRYLGRRGVWVSIAAASTLVSEVAGFPLAHTVSQDGIVGASASWWLLGALYVPYVLPVTFSAAPLWVMPLVAVGIGAGVASWFILRKRVPQKALGVVVVTMGMLASWGAAEASVEIATRSQAARQFEGYCNFRRVSTLEMVANGLSDFGVRTHATLTDRTHHYLWSFNESRWVLRNACHNGECWCLHDPVGLPIKGPKLD